MNPITVCILFGGRSAEHEISLISAASIIRNLDTSKYNLMLVGISKTGEWLYFHGDPITHVQDPKNVALSPHGIPVAINLDTRGQLFQPIRITDTTAIPTRRPHVIFPILHGTYGEDGTVQGLFEMAQVAYVGSGVLGSAAGMDKETMKRLLRDAGVPVTPFLSFNISQRHHEELSWEKVRAKLGPDIFVKPANLGSSVGITHVTRPELFEAAIDLAFEFDRKVLLEKTIKGREIEVAVLGNSLAGVRPQASLPGEVKANHDFYSYEAKYIDPNGAQFSIPVTLPKSIEERVRELALQTYQALGLAGLTRVDLFFQESTGELFINEVNTMPGFTSISMYPKLWECSGLAYKDLLDRLIQLAIEEYKAKQKLKTSF